MTSGTDTVNSETSSLQTANVCIWFFQERDKLLRYRKQRKKMTRIPKVKRKSLYYDMLASQGAPSASASAGERSPQGSAHESQS